MGDETFNLLAGGLAEGLGTAEIDGVGLDQVRIELVLADELAEAIANFGPAVVSVLAIDQLGRELLRLPRGWNRFGKRADFLDRADSDAVGLAQGPVDRPSLSYPHFGAADQWRHIRRIGITVADEALASPGLEYRSLECPVPKAFIAELAYRVAPNPVTAPSIREA